MKLSDLALRAERLLVPLNLRRVSKAVSEQEIRSESGSHDIRGGNSA